MYVLIDGGLVILTEGAADERALGNFCHTVSNCSRLGSLMTYGYTLYAISMGTCTLGCSFTIFCGAICTGLCTRSSKMSERNLSSSTTEEKSLMTPCFSVDVERTPRMEIDFAHDDIHIIDIIEIDTAEGIAAHEEDYDGAITLGGLSRANPIFSPLFLPHPVVARPELAVTPTAHPLGICFHL